MITATLVKQLREITSTGMMECKKALEESKGDLEAAITIMRKSGQAKAAKKVDRIAAEGAIATKFGGDNKSAIIVEVNCETDFASRDKLFLEFVDTITSQGLKNKVGNLNEFLTMVLDNGQTVSEMRESLVAKIGENINIRRVRLLTIEGNGIIGGYIHGNGCIGVLVGISIINAELAKDIAMHIAACKPVAILPEELPQELLQKEKEIVLAQLQDTKKPPEILEKISLGRVQKFISEITLIKQSFVKNPDITVEELLGQFVANVLSFIRFEVGEGIEKKRNRFCSRSASTNNKSLILNTVKNFKTISIKNKPRRIVLKLSGEALMGKKEFGIDSKIIKALANDIKPLVVSKIQVGMVVGGGNFFRGALLNDHGISRIAGDHLGMIATMLNAIAIQDVFVRLKIPTKVMSALPIEGFIERYNRLHAIDYLKQGFVVVFAGGTGNPLVTTDTALCLRGIELEADLILKATNVDGVYSKDPKKNPDAKLYHKLTYDKVLEEKLAVMDLSAFFLGRDHKMKLRVFNIRKKGALLRIMQGLDEGTLIS